MISNLATFSWGSLRLRSHVRLGALVVIVLLTLVVRDPIGSAHGFRTLLGWAGDVIDGLATFASALSAER